MSKKTKSSTFPTNIINEKGTKKEGKWYKNNTIMAYVIILGLIMVLQFNKTSSAENNYENGFKESSKIVKQNHPKLKQPLDTIVTKLPLKSPITTTTRDITTTKTTTETNIYTAKTGKEIEKTTFACLQFSIC